MPVKWRGILDHRTITGRLKILREVHSTIKRQIPYRKVTVLLSVFY
jgi:hypothetical protein